MKFDNYDKVFTPGAPMSTRTFFFGREQSIVDMRRSIKRPGIHPIVIGDRGVGKTSLANLVLKDTRLPTYRLNCNKHMTYDNFAHALLDLLEVNGNQIELIDSEHLKVDGSLKPMGVGVGTSGEKRHTERRKGIGAIRMDPWRLFCEIRKLDRKVVIVLDEYDAIPSSAAQFHSGIADLIKTFADNADTCDSRLVVVGVARSAGDLLGKHESIERSAREIFLRTLRREDITDFLTEAEKKLQFAFAPSVKRDMVWSSMGFPYFVHLVGLESLDTMVERQKRARLVTEDDYVKGVDRAIQKAFRAELRKYRKAVKGLGKNEINVMRELSKYAQSKNVSRPKLQHRITEKGLMSEDQFNTAWVNLQQERKVLYVSRANDSIKFCDPLMAPFLRTTVFRNKHKKTKKDEPKSKPNDQLRLFGSSEEGAY